MVRIRKILLVVVSVLVGIFFILPLIGVGILKWAVLPPEKLTPLVVEKTNEFIEAHLECERVELTYFETYPYLGVKLTNGRLISNLAEDSIGYQEDLMILRIPCCLSKKRSSYLTLRIICLAGR